MHGFGSCLFGLGPGPSSIAGGIHELDARLIEFRAQPFGAVSQRLELGANIANLDFELRRPLLGLLEFAASLLEQGRLGLGLFGYRLDPIEFARGLLELGAQLLEFLAQVADLLVRHVEFAAEPLFQLLGASLLRRKLVTTRLELLGLRPGLLDLRTGLLGLGLSLVGFETGLIGFGSRLLRSRLGLLGLSSPLIGLGPRLVCFDAGLFGFGNGPFGLRTRLFGFGQRLLGRRARHLDFGHGLLGLSLGSTGFVRRIHELRPHQFEFFAQAGRAFVRLVEFLAQSRLQLFGVTLLRFELLASSFELLDFGPRLLGFRTRLIGLGPRLLERDLGSASLVLGGDELIARLIQFFAQAGSALAGLLEVAAHTSERLFQVIGTLLLPVELPTASLELVDLHTRLRGSGLGAADFAGGFDQLRPGLVEFLAQVGNRVGSLLEFAACAVQRGAQFFRTLLLDLEIATPLLEVRGLLASLLGLGASLLDLQPELLHLGAGLLDVGV